MKHIFIIETASTIGPRGVENLREDIQNVADKSLGEGANVLHYSCNANSAIRAVYRMYGAPDSQSPDQLGSAK